MEFILKIIFSIVVSIITWRIITLILDHCSVNFVDFLKRVWKKIRKPKNE